MADVDVTFYQDDDGRLWQEKDPNGLAANAPGAKNDAGKVDYTYLQDISLALAAVCRLFEFGANKYSRGGWQHVPDGRARYTKALLRHYFKEEVEDVDPDTDMEHDIAVAWNALTRLELRLREAQSGE